MVNFNRSEGNHISACKKKVSLPEFLQPILSEKTKLLKKELPEPINSSSDDEEIETPLAIPSKEKTVNSTDRAATSNFSVLSCNFNSNCVKYYSNKKWTCLFIIVHLEGIGNDLNGWDRRIRKIPM